jgi:hypothetical protein
MAFFSNGFDLREMSTEISHKHSTSQYKYLTPENVKVLLEEKKALYNSLQEFENGHTALRTLKPFLNKYNITHKKFYISLWETCKNHPKLLSEFYTLYTIIKNSCHTMSPSNVIKKIIHNKTYCSLILDTLANTFSLKSGLIFGASRFKLKGWEGLFPCIDERFLKDHLISHTGLFLEVYDVFDKNDYLTFYYYHKHFCSNDRHAYNMMSKYYLESFLTLVRDKNDEKKIFSNYTLLLTMIRDYLKKNSPLKYVDEQIFFHIKMPQFLKNVMELNNPTYWGKYFVQTNGYDRYHFKFSQEKLWQLLYLRNENFLPRFLEKPMSEKEKNRVAGALRPLQEAWKNHHFP